MTISELIEALKYEQDPNEPELEVWAYRGNCVADKIRSLKRSTVFIEGNPKTVAMLMGSSDKYDRE